MQKKVKNDVNGYERSSAHLSVAKQNFRFSIPLLDRTWLLDLSSTSGMGGISHSPCDVYVPRWNLTSTRTFHADELCQNSLSTWMKAEFYLEVQLPTPYEIRNQTELTNV